MYTSIYREKFDGFAIGRVERDQDFTSKLGFYHNEYQIQYIFKGERFFFVDGRCYRLSEGCIAIIDKSLIAKTCIIGGHFHDRLLIEIEEKSFRPIAEMFGMDIGEFFKKHHGVYQVGDNEVMKRILSDIENGVLKDKSKTREGKLKNYILQIMLEQEKWDKKKTVKFNDEGVKSHIDKQKRVHQVADYIAKNYATIDSVDSLARRFYMSNSYLCRIFKEVTNFTISEYINLYRIAASKEYLMNEDMSMAEIANRLGYDSLTYFERVFKKQMAVTPFQYRKTLTRHR